MRKWLTKKIHSFPTGNWHMEVSMEATITEVFKKNGNPSIWQFLPQDPVILGSQCSLRASARNGSSDRKEQTSPTITPLSSRGPGWRGLCQKLAERHRGAGVNKSQRRSKMSTVLPHLVWHHARLYHFWGVVWSCETLKNLGKLIEKALCHYGLRFSHSCFLP